MSAPVRMLLGLLKGAAIGTAAGIGFWFLLPGGNLNTWISMLLGGALVGVVCGTPFWKKDQWVVTLVRAIFGLGIGALANFLLDRFAYGLSLPLFVPQLGGSWTLAPIGDNWIGVAAFCGIWGMLVDLDASFDDSADANANKKK